MRINEKVKSYFQEVDENLLIRVLFEMNRYFDKSFTGELQKYQQNKQCVFNQNDRNEIRKKYYYGKYLLETEYTDFVSISPTEQDEILVQDDFLNRVSIYGEDKIVSSIKEKIVQITKGKKDDNISKWLDFYHQRNESLYSYQGILININQNIYASNGFSFDFLYSLITQAYNGLANYRYMILKISGRLFSRTKCDVTWSLISKAIIYCENFKLYKDKFFPFKKDKQISSLAKFIGERLPEIDSGNLAKGFYQGISMGFQFEDCLVNDKNDEYIISFRKIVLDESPIPCPECMTTIQSGNSYSEVFLKSYECKNPNCPSRSKSGRGKRFDENGVYRFAKLVENDELNVISKKLYDSWKRDIYDSNNNPYEMILKYYFWGGEKIATFNCELDNTYGRNLFELKLNKNATFIGFDELPIVHLLKEINSNIVIKNDGNVLLQKNVELFNADSTKTISSFANNQIGSVITSPPYYNAREYSQWENVVMYYIDMLFNIKTIYDRMIQNGYYLYNIGDIVGEDNIYVKSNMSKRRIPLGSYTVFLFELAGFTLTGNIIWDKGQVQSKRNSTINLNTGYIKFINCYEHVYVFRKGGFVGSNSSVSKFHPVIKINCNGENVYKHTAPYPMEMVDLLKPFINPDLYVLDQYLGSGTTVKWCINYGYKCVGIELNEEYYKLTLDYMYETPLFE